MTIRIASALLLAGALGLNGCASTPTPASLSTTLAMIASDIVGYAGALCSFQPQIATVEGIVTALYPAANAATVPEQAIAQTICATIPPPPAAGKLGAAASVLYPGTRVAIHGRYCATAGCAAG
jgi:hypothetical protein